MNVRLEAFHILNRLFRGEQIFLDKHYSSSIKTAELSISDRSFLVQLVRGIVKFYPQLQEMAATYLPKPKSLPKKVQIIVYLGLFQLSVDTRIPDYAVVSETVELARLTDCHPWIKLVNAVMRKAATERSRWSKEAEHWSMVLPQWLERYWKKFLTEDEMNQLKKSLILPPILYLRVNTLKTNAQRLLEALYKKYSIVVHSLPTLPNALSTQSDYTQLVETDEYQKGYFSIHDFSSQVMVHLFAPKPGEKIVDIGCGSGGKTLMMAQIMKNQGCLYAVDVHQEKLKTLEALARRQGIDIIQTIRADATQPLPQELLNVDRVFVDAPCSGWGTLRRNPEILFLRNESDNKSFAEKQFQLLYRASAFIKKSGIIFYCVCTMTPEETEGVMEAFEKRISEGWKMNFPEEGQLQAELKPIIIADGKSYIIWPHYFHSDGFFGKAWRKL
ncbi:MAG: methyltransferase domain-containing protein [Candidatus Atribacteria bacterium]|nr:methyltransferase domain-containing protein [Candidatus Atribacteria bacterium]